MLKLQEFILANKDWREQLEAAPYNLKIKEEGDLILFKYNQIASDFSNPIVCECRGIILEKDTWRIVRIAFNKFFNIGEPNAATLDWDSAIATEKLDGSLMSVYYYDDEWKIATNSTIDAYKAPLDNGGFKTYGDLFAKAAEIAGLDYTKLCKHYTYTFELCSRYNKVVLDYPEIKLYHILTRDNETFEELDVNIGVPKPAEYALGNKEDYENFVASMGEDHEGIVVKDDFNNRVKIKTQSYFALHRLVNNHIMTLTTAIELILKNETAELLAYFPEFQPYIDQVQLQLHEVKVIIEDIKEKVKAEKENKNKKEFVQWVGNNELRTVYYAAYDDKLHQMLEYDESDEDEVLQRKIRSLIKIFKLDS